MMKMKHFLFSGLASASVAALGLVPAGAVWADPAAPAGEVKADTPAGAAAKDTDTDPRTYWEGREVKLIELIGATVDKVSKENTGGANVDWAAVKASVEIASALAPDGIPSEILLSALKPINDRIAESVSRTGWKPVIITEDMTITYNGRPHSLSSESAKWRTNAMISEAISYVSGLKMIVLDGFDILSLEGRGELIGWLDQLASNNEIDTALIFGTLKSLPSGLPDTIQAHWIAGGVIKDRAEAA